MTSVRQEAAEAPTLYDHQTGLITSLAPHHTNMGNYSPSLDLLNGMTLTSTGQGQAQHRAATGSSGSISFGLGAGLRPNGPFGGPSMPERKTEQSGEKQLCTFFLRTGTCAYGDRCKFKHPLDRPPPQLNTRGMGTWTLGHL